jgi:SpoVK/Ycf46/Vps4 family AAA+-type ATPase
MAAEIIANDLELDLYKIDLSQVVSKYIGETEKNLDKIFQEAGTSNAILFFDEADALFGKRSEVKDARDRYANIEIAYLLQEIEDYDGIAILATNLRQNLDEAFTRRLDFLVDFPFPESEYRRQIWLTHFPPRAPQP